MRSHALPIALASALCLSLVALPQSWLQFHWSSEYDDVAEGTFSTYADLAGDCVAYAPKPGESLAYVEQTVNLLKEAHPGLPVLLIPFRNRECVTAAEADSVDPLGSFVQGAYPEDIFTVIWMIVTRIEDGATVFCHAESFAALTLLLALRGDHHALRAFLPDFWMRHPDLQCTQGTDLLANDVKNLEIYMGRRSLQLYITTDLDRALVWPG